MKEQPKQYYRLFIRVINKKKPIKIDEQGNKWIETKWVEVPSANLGSFKVPNKKIIEFRFEPFSLEKPETKKINLRDLFGGLV